jgi:hypothetical protein
MRMIEIIGIPYYISHEILYYLISCVEEMNKQTILKSTSLII